MSCCCSAAACGSGWFRERIQGGRGRAEPIGWRAGPRGRPGDRYRGASRRQRKRDTAQVTRQHCCLRVDAGVRIGAGFACFASLWLAGAAGEPQKVLVGAGYATDTEPQEADEPPQIRQHRSVADFGWPRDCFIVGFVFRSRRRAFPRWGTCTSFPRCRHRRRACSPSSVFVPTCVGLVWRVGRSWLTLGGGHPVLTPSPRNRSRAGESWWLVIHVSAAAVVRSSGVRPADAQVSSAVPPARA